MLLSLEGAIFSIQDLCKAHYGIGGTNDLVEKSCNVRPFIDMNKTEGKTALHYAAEKGKVCHIRLLAEYSGDVSMQDNPGRLH